MSFPKTSKVNDSVQVIVDRLTKLTHFIVIKICYPLQKLVELYIKKVVQLAWYSFEYCVGWEYEIHNEVLEEFVRSVGY